MEAKVNKTILNHNIKHFQFFRKYNWGLGKTVTTGTIHLEGGKKISIEGSQFYLKNSDEVIEGIVLKSNPGYRRIKHMISRFFSSYRKNGNCQHVGYWRSRANDGLHNINLFRISGISFKNNKSTFLRLAS
jgi:hypothetical protein